MKALPAPGKPPLPALPGPSAKENALALANPGAASISRMSWRNQLEEPEAIADEEEEGETWEDRRQEAIQENRDTCRSIVIFGIFLITFTVSMLLELSSPSSLLSDHIIKKLDSKEFPLSHVSTLPAFYDYLEQVFVPQIYTNDTDTALALSLSKTLAPIDVANRLVGVVQMREVRVNPVRDCEISPLFSAYVIDCNPTLSVSGESTTAYGPENIFVYGTDSGGNSYTGSLATYSPNGFMQILPTNRTTAAVQLEKLRDQGWLDTTTRAVFIEFNVWSSNFGVYATVMIVFEFGASGTVAQKIDILTMTERAVTPGGLKDQAGWTAFAFIILVMVLVAFFILEEFQELWGNGLFVYIQDPWNVIDWVNVILLIIGFIMRILNFQTAANIVSTGNITNPSVYTNLRALVESVETVKLLNGFNAVLVWGKCVKYFRHIPIVKDLVKVVWSAFTLFVPFLCMFCVGFIGFSMSYNIGFGDKILQLNSMPTSFVYLCRAFFRDGKLRPAYDITPIFGAFLILIFYVAFILVGVNIMFAMMAFAVFEEKQNQKKNARTSKDLEEEDLHEGEPIEELIRDVNRISEWAFHAFLPLLCPRFYRLWQRSHQRQRDEEDSGSTATSSGKNRMALADGRAGSRGGSSETRSNSDGQGEWGAIEDQGHQFSQEELLRAIEHMSGRVLSEMSVVGIEIKSELHDVCERVAQMQMAVEELSWRVEQVRLEQLQELS